MRGDQRVQEEANPIDLIPRVCEMAKVDGRTPRYTEYVWRVGLTVLAGGPHYVGFPIAYRPIYLTYRLPW